MGTISVSLPSDGTTADVADYNTPINTIVNEFNGNIDNANIKAAAAIAGSKIADGAITNAKLSTATGEPGAAWQTWTPTWANFTVGSATIVAKYIQQGKVVRFKLSVTLNSSTMGTAPTFTLPVTSATVDIANGYIGQARLRDANGDVNPGAVLLGTTTIAGLIAYDANSTFPRESAITSSSPFTWANTDTIQAVGEYEAA